MRVLIIDDEDMARLNIKVQLDKTIKFYEAANYQEAKRLLEKEKFDLCFIDLHLDSTSNLLGLDLLPLAVAKGIYPVVMSSHESDEVVQKAYDLGCKDYYAKGNESQNVSDTLNRYFLSRHTFASENIFTDVFPTKNERQKILITRLAPIISTEIPICLLGESGTGKSYLASKIHQLSKRKGEFIEINCAALGEELLEAELFGHAKGAFTGAVHQSTGKLGLADNGTLFLDEIGSMSHSMQSKLLKAIEEKSYYPVNSDKKVKSNFRVLCATLDDIEDMVRSGKFRFDLFQRICGVSVKLLPLRERREDILPTIKTKISSTRRTVFSSEARKIIEEYEWPGNIREALRFAEIISQTSSGVISQQDVASFISKSTFKSSASFITDKQYELIRSKGLNHFIEEVIKEAIKLSLEKNENAVRRSIEELQISSARFYRYYEKRSHQPLFAPVEAEEIQNELH